MRPRGGFTLIEVVLAIALTGLVLSAATTFLVIVSGIWLSRNDESFFQQHASGATAFVKGLVARAEPPAEGDGGPVQWNRPPGYGDFEDPLLAFRLSEPPAILGPEAVGLAGLQLYLYHAREEGLYLIWHSDLIETEETRDLRHTLVSPLVTEVAYAYYDAEFDDWEIETQPRTAETVTTFVLPDYLRFTLSYQGQEELFYVPIPTAKPEIPPF